jgi:serine/threonine-protein kinase RsbW
MMNQPSENRKSVEWPKPFSFAFRCSNTPEAGKKMVDRLLDQMPDSFRAKADLGVAMGEAISNAIYHGGGIPGTENEYGKKDPNPKNVFFCAVQVNQDCIIVEVEDQGAGFNPRDVPDSTREENLEKQSGRGLTLMRAFMSSVTYNTKGNRVRLVLRRDQQEGEEGVLVVSSDESLCLLDTMKGEMQPYAAHHESGASIPHLADGDSPIRKAVDQLLSSA